MPRRRKTEDSPPEPPSVEDYEQHEQYENMSLPEFSRLLLSDNAVRKSLIQQARRGELPPTLLIRFWDATEGKPSGQSTRGDATLMTDEELDDQIQRLVRKYNAAESDG